MRITPLHASHVGNMIAIDLNKSSFVTLNKGVEVVAAEASKIILADLEKEDALEERVRELVDTQEEDIEFFQADERQLFWMIKKKLAKEFGVLLNFEDRYSDVAHQILDQLYEEDLAQYDVKENQVKNIIFSAIEHYMEAFSEIETAVATKMEGYKRKLHYGSEEYEIVFDKLYSEELMKRGMA
jgi:uncharacterized protein